ncbi:MAG: hypothetical protein ACXAB2_12750, partial [Candidatus Hodarchaeales archaeon]
ESDAGHAVIQTHDGGLVIAGITSSYGTEGTIGIFDQVARAPDIWLVKTDANGTILSSSITTIPSSTTISSSTTIPGWGPLSLLVAAVVLTTWYKRRKKLG